MIAADTSVVVAAFATWHEGHTAARAALQQRTRIPAQVAVEAYSVLTRLPPTAPHRAEATLVVQRLLREAARNGSSVGRCMTRLPA